MACDVICRVLLELALYIILPL